VFAVLVVDMINDFVTGKLRLERAEKIIPTIRRLLDFARSKGIPIIYINDSHPTDDREFKLWGPHAIAGTEGAQIIPELKPKGGDRILKKSSYSAFFDTELNDLLQRLKATKLLLTGVSTDVCIQNTAADAFFRGYEIIVLSNCVGAFNEEVHRRALEYIERVYGGRVITSDEFMKSWV
jgi:nicotinamidase-related amidase